jgi:transcriptional regulator with XRE-family HTH domain
MLTSSVDRTSKWEGRKAFSGQSSIGLGQVSCRRGYRDGRGGCRLAQGSYVFCCQYGNIPIVDSTVGFGQRLAQLLEEREMTQLDLAARVGVTRAAMSRYVSGDREPRFVTLVRIAEELDVHVDELLGSGVGSVDAAVRLVARVRLTDEQKAALRQVLAGET